MSLKFLVIGLGSMGKRRIRCLKSLGYTDIIGFDMRKDRCEETSARYGIKTSDNWDSVKNKHLNVWIISTPPNFHMKYAFEAASLKNNFFMEANVSSAGMEDLIDIIKSQKIVGVPSCTMRYFDGVKKIKQMIINGDIGTPLYFNYHWGQYLPTWHVYERYQDFYVSNRETGAVREIVPFQLEWLVDIFGFPSKVSCLKGKMSNLDADIDDIYQLQMLFKNKVMGSLTVDVFSQPAVNHIRIIGSHGTIEFDQHQKKMRIYNVSNEEWIDVPISEGNVESGYIYSEDPYVEEIGDFIGEILEKNKYPYTLLDDIKVLNLLKRAEQSDRNGIHN